MNNRAEAFKKFLEEKNINSFQGFCCKVLNLLSNKVE